jgi:hypothetical protein
MLTKLTIESIPEDDIDKDFVRKVEITTGEVTIDKFFLNFCSLLIAHGFSNELVKKYMDYEELM